MAEILFPELQYQLFEFLKQLRSTSLRPVHFNIIIKQRGLTKFTDTE